MLRKSVIILLGLLIVAFLFVFHEPLLQWIQNADRRFVWITTIIATLMSLFPVIPYPLVGSVIGAAYGPILGALSSGSVPP
ncbi:MAG: hypothetical protein LRY73_00280 [Bacillus sp. (in: Bacteria)]|nr:hypothetical protein [Bacillus sp. (in: firmicutes)]